MKTRYLEAFKILQEVIKLEYIGEVPQQIVGKKINALTKTIKWMRG